MPDYLVRDKMHQCCEITAASVTVESHTGDLVFHSETAEEVARIAAGWIGYAQKGAVVGYSVEVLKHG